MGGRDALRRTPLLVDVIVRNARSSGFCDFISRLTTGSRQARRMTATKPETRLCTMRRATSRRNPSTFARSRAEPDTKNNQERPVTLLRPRASACMSVLIEFGADFEALDCLGKSPIHRALAHGHLAVVGVLLNTERGRLGLPWMAAPR